MLANFRIERIFPLSVVHGPERCLFDGGSLTICRTIGSTLSNAVVKPLLSDGEIEGPRRNAFDSRRVLT